MQALQSFNSTRIIHTVMIATFACTDVESQVIPEYTGFLSEASGRS